MPKLQGSFIAKQDALGFTPGHELGDWLEAEQELKLN
jgi:Protein of unknown function (DUF2934)